MQKELRSCLLNLCKLLHLIATQVDHNRRLKMRRIVSAADGAGTVILYSFSRAERWDF